jgi:AraC-like DNA-binding protein
MLMHLSVDDRELSPGSELSKWPEGWTLALLRSGFGYWLAGKETHELQPGDVLVLAPTAKGLLRVSRIASGSICLVSFAPEQLAGLMSVSERQALEALAQQQPARIIRAQELSAQEFARVAGEPARRRSFLYRSRVLHLVALVFGDVLPGTPQGNGRMWGSNNRFEEVMARVTDADLLNHSPEELAKICGCSVRHLRRMFRSKFGTSIRAKQTALRLEKARHLLTETRDTVASVAQQTGYQHLGLFCAMFRKRYGMTPGEWRDQARREAADSPVMT